MRWAIGVLSIVLLGFLLRSALSVLGRAFVEGTVAGVLFAWSVTLLAVLGAWALLAWVQH
jgi:hypothetical protein